MKTHINAAGVVLSAAGAFLVWHFVTELNFVNKESYLKGQGSIEIPNPSPEDIRKFRFKMKMSKLGLTLILVGGFLQVVGTYMD
jgi:hypothetical protein